MAARARPPAKKKPIKAPPVPLHRRQIEATTTTVTFEPEGEYESIDAQFIQERISDTVHQNVRETTFSPAQASTAHVQEQLAGQLQQPPQLSYSMVKPKAKPYQRKMEEVEIREVAPSLKPAAASLIMPSPPSGAGIQHTDDQGSPPYPPAVTTQPLQTPINTFGFTRERQKPARDYKFLVAAFFCGGILCLPCCPISCIACICFAAAAVASNTAKKHNTDGDYVSAQTCSIWTLLCSVTSLVCYLTIPTIITLAVVIDYVARINASRSRISP